MSLASPLFLLSLRRGEVGGNESSRTTLERGDAADEEAGKDVTDARSAVDATDLVTRSRVGEAGRGGVENDAFLEPLPVDSVGEQGRGELFLLPPVT